MDKKQVKLFFKIGDKEVLERGFKKLKLTDEELKISIKLTKEWSEEMIAQEMNMSKRTIQRRKKKIYEKVFTTLNGWEELEEKLKGGD